MLTGRADVDNIDVSDFTVNEGDGSPCFPSSSSSPLAVAPLVVGERGSEVRLTFSRGEEVVEARTIDRGLTCSL